MKAVLGNWGDIKVSDINRLLKPLNVKLVKKTSKAWGTQVSITAHLIKDPLVVGPNLTATKVLSRQKDAVDRFPSPAPFDSIEQATGRAP